jgi:hypothetical protein
LVKIAAPPPTNKPRPVFLNIRANTNLLRIYNPTKHGQTCCSFRRFGPTARFDHHRHPDAAPAEDTDRGVYYAAPTLSSCIVEVFGDIGQIVCGDSCLAMVRPNRDLRMLDLCGNGAMRAGTVSAIAKADHRLSRDWSRYFYQEPIYKLADGIQYYNAHNDEIAYMLFERAETALECIEEMRLDDDRLRRQLAFIAKRTNLLLSP